MIYLTCDGSFNKTQGRGGWSFIISKENDGIDSVLEEKYGACSDYNVPINSDRAELEALYQGLKYVKRKYKDHDVHIQCDNKMACDGIIGTASRNSYRELWSLIEKQFNRDVRFSLDKIEAHKTHILNKRADKLANVGRNSLLIIAGRVYDGRKI